MEKRPYLKLLLQWGITAVIAFIAAKWGIVIPPLPEIPSQAEPIPEKPSPKLIANAAQAISRITFGSSGCTATPVGEPRPDGRIWVLTAAHCVREVGQRGTLYTQKGEQLTVTVAGIDSIADCAWLLTDSTSLHIPFAELSDQIPQPGAKVWHAGYGVHMPRNTEYGTFVSGPDSNGQLRFRLSVSSGDSGGAIVIDEQGRILSCVCCTSARGQTADVWGSGPIAIASLRRSIVEFPDWKPADIPIRKE